jgi:iron complex outermembrane receptor protein
MLFANGAVHLTTGLRAEYNTLNGIGFQPNARLLWKINHVHSVWLSYSLANRSESPFDTSARINLAAFPGRTGLQVLRFVGNPDILPERVNAFEMGYRIQPRKTLSFDLATFYNRYSRVLGTALGPPFFELGPPPRLVLPLVSQNNISGPSFGGEFTAHWAPVSRVRFTTAYSFIELDLVQTPSALGDNASQINGSTPRHKLALDNSVNLARTVSLSTALSFADRRTALRIPGYTLVDSTLVWCPKPAVELRIGAKNLFNKEHPEFIAEGGTRAIIMGRSFYAKTTWRFGGR